MDVPGEQDAARAVEQLRQFLTFYEGVEVRPDSRIAKQLARARHAVAAYEHVQAWTIEQLEPTDAAAPANSVSDPKRRN